MQRSGTQVSVYLSAAVSLSSQNTRGYGDSVRREEGGGRGRGGDG